MKNTMVGMADSFDSSGGGPRARRRFLVAIGVLLVLFALIVLQRDRIRAHWWAHQLRQTENFDARAYYLASLSAVGAPATGAVTRLARAEEEAIRLLAVPLLESLPDSRGFGELERLLNDTSVDVRESAALALAFTRSDVARHTLLRAAEAEAANPAAAAVAALARVDLREAVGPLCRALATHPAPRVRAQAAESLAAGLLAAADDPPQKAGPRFPERADPFLALVRATDDAAPFTGLLSLERSIADARAFASAAGARPAETAPAGRSRRVADVAAKALLRLTGRAVAPRLHRDRSEQAVFADRCRRWYWERIHASPNAARRRQSEPGGSSDTSPERN